MFCMQFQINSVVKPALAEHDPARHVSRGCLRGSWEAEYDAFAQHGVQHGFRLTVAFMDMRSMKLHVCIQASAHWWSVRVVA